jgi:hypothetical protein
VLAAKTNTPHHNKNSNDIGSGSSTDNSSISGNTDSSTTNNTPPSTSNDNESLKNLFACESAAANGSGALTKTDLINCYTQTFPDNSAGSGSSNSPEGDIGASSSSSDSGSSTSNHTHIIITIAQVAQMIVPQARVKALKRLCVHPGTESSIRQLKMYQKRLLQSNARWGQN